MKWGEKVVQLNPINEALETLQDMLESDDHYVAAVWVVIDNKGDSRFWFGSKDYSLSLIGALELVKQNLLEDLGYQAFDVED